MTGEAETAGRFPPAVASPEASGILLVDKPR